MSSGGFMGAMFGAQIVADRIAHEAWMQRDQIDRLHNQAGNFAVLRERYTLLVRQHDQLASDYNKLNAWAKGLAARYDQQAVDLASLRKENEKLRARVKELTLDVTFLRELDRELHPEAHRCDKILGY